MAGSQFNKILDDINNIYTNVVIA